MPVANVTKIQNKDYSFKIMVEEVENFKNYPRPVLYTNGKLLIINYNGNIEMSRNFNNNARTV